MRLSVRDYFTCISLYGVIMATDGLQLLHAIPRNEIIGGVQAIIGMWTILWGLIFLHFSADAAPGLIDQLLNKLMQRMGLALSS